MPMYYFDLRDDETITDTDGTDLADVAAARDHAAVVARELTMNSHGFLDERWTEWTMSVHDSTGTELFSFALSGSEYWQNRK
jgi:hypothetical protein